MSDFQPQDRSLVNKMLAVIPVIAQKVGHVLAAAQENPQLREQLATALAERDAARADLADDERSDADQLGPLADAIDALERLVTPAAEADSAVVPVADVVDVPAIVDDELDPGSQEGRTVTPESPADGDDPLRTGGE